MKYKKYSFLTKNFKNKGMVNKNIVEKPNLISNKKSLKSKLKALDEYELKKLKEKMENISLSERKYFSKTNLKIENFRKAKESILKKQLLKSYSFQKTRIEEGITYITKYMETLREGAKSEVVNKIIESGEELLNLSKEVENTLKGKEEVGEVVEKLEEIMRKIISKATELEDLLKELRIGEDKKSLKYRIKEVREASEGFGFALSKAKEIYKKCIK